MSNRQYFAGGADFQRGALQDRRPTTPIAADIAHWIRPSQAQTGDRPQQPAQVEARRAQNWMQRVNCFTLEPVPAQAVIRFQMPDDRFDRLTALEQSALARIEPFGFASASTLR